MQQIILASGSFRRQEMMKWLGIPFHIVVSNFPEESVQFDEFDDPEEYVSVIAAGKAQAVLDNYPDALVIASDTIVLLDGEVFGKPKDLDHAREMLKKLSGRTHAVYSAVVVVDGETNEWKSEVVRSEVTFFPLSRELIEQYIATSEPYDKAGGYALQGFAKRFVREVKGSAANVVGFPIFAVRDLLEGFGVPVEVNLERSVQEKLGYSS